MPVNGELVAVEIADGKRFAFGKNWTRFLKTVREEHFKQAEQSLVDMVGCPSLAGKTFLDIGSGSGLFSLCARRLGARVVSFDFDPDSVSCARELKRRFFPSDPDWKIEQASILDAHYVHELGQFDVVYSWGVLHHTGKMWEAVQNAITLVKEDNGVLCLALYNDQGFPSSIWKAIKATYCRLPRLLKWTVLLPCFVRLWAPTVMKDCLKQKPFSTWINYSRNRGMSPWQDVVDWVGGYPFEVCKPEEVLDRCLPFGLSLIRLKTCRGRHGCNQFVFVRSVKSRKGQ